MKTPLRKDRKVRRLSDPLEKSLARYALATVSAAAVAVPATVKADFSGPYDPMNWSFQNTGGSSNGSVDTSGAPSFISVIGGSSGTMFPNGPGTTDFTIAAFANGVVSFDWTYASFDSTDYEGGRFLLNGVPFLLSNNYSGASGNFSIGVNQGDVFGFQVFSMLNVYGQGMLDISNFNAPLRGRAVPESASTLLLLALGAAGVEILRRRRAR